VWQTLHSLIVPLCPCSRIDCRCRARSGWDRWHGAIRGMPPVDLTVAVSLPVAVQRRFVCRQVLVRTVDPFRGSHAPWQECGSSRRQAVDPRRAIGTADIRHTAVTSTQLDADLGHRVAQTLCLGPGWHAWHSLFRQLAAGHLAGVKGVHGRGQAKVAALAGGDAQSGPRDRNCTLRVGRPVPWRAARSPVFVVGSRMLAMLPWIVSATCRAAASSLTIRERR